MTKFHVNANGQAGACGATSGRCPFGGPDGSENHYDSKEQAAMAAMEASLGRAREELGLTAVRNDDGSLMEFHIIQDSEVDEVLRHGEEEQWRSANGSLWQGATLIVGRDERDFKLAEAVKARQEQLRYEADVPTNLPHAEVFREVVADNDYATLEEIANYPWGGTPQEAFDATMARHEAEGWSEWGNADDLNDEDKAYIVAKEMAIEVDKARGPVTYPASPSPEEAPVVTDVDQTLELVGKAFALDTDDRDPRHRYGSHGQPKEVTDRLAKITQLETASASAQRRMRMADTKKEFAELSTKKGDIDRQLGRLRMQQLAHEAGKAHSSGKTIDPNFIEALRNMYAGKFGRRPEEDGVDTGTLIAMFNKGELA